MRCQWSPKRQVNTTHTDWHMLLKRYRVRLNSWGGENPMIFPNKVQNDTTHGFLHFSALRRSYMDNRVSGNTHPELSISGVFRAR